MLERVKYEADQEKNVSAEKRKIAQKYAQVNISYVQSKNVMNHNLLTIDS